MYCAHGRGRGWTNPKSAPRVYKPTRGMSPTKFQSRSMLCGDSDHHFPSRPNVNYQTGSLATSTWMTSAGLTMARVSLGQFIPRSIIARTS